MPSPKSKAPKAKLPKHAVPRVMHANMYKWGDHPISVHLSHRHATKMRGWPCEGTFPVLVLPCANLQSARARLRWERLSDAEKVEAMAKAMFSADYIGNEDWNKVHNSTRNSLLNQARSILSLQSSPAKGGREK